MLVQAFAWGAGADPEEWRRRAGFGGARSRHAADQRVRGRRAERDIW